MSLEYESDNKDVGRVMQGMSQCTSVSSFSEWAEVHVSVNFEQLAISTLDRLTGRSKSFILGHFQQLRAVRQVSCDISREVHMQSDTTRLWSERGNNKLVVRGLVMVRYWMVVDVE